MGRPYSEELDAVPLTYAWASRSPIDDLVELVRKCAGRPLYAVGSGGSFTAATLASALHQQGGRMSRCMTPLEFVWDRRLDGEACVAIVTAGGDNRDILASFDRAAACAPLIGIVSTNAKSRLAGRAAGAGNALVHAARPPSGRDGFLATNSLLATMLWLSRAYVEGLSLPYEIPEFGRLSPRAPGAFEGARGKKTLVVLHDDWGKAAAVDAESKMHEAGLANVQLSDYRNFAHGRHNWLDKAPGETCVVAMITPRCLGLAGRTLGQLPAGVPVVRLETGLDGPAAAIDLTLQVFRLVEFFGAERGIDPGRPGVRDFGRRLYGIGVPNLCEDGLSDFERLALRRKFGSAVPRAKSRQNSLRRFVSGMLRQEFGAVVFGYGALCDDGRRPEGPAPEIGSMLAGLIGRGVSVGVAAGRGDPARAQLARLLPGRCRAGVLVGYDGAGTGGLSDRAADPGAPGSLFGLIKERLPAGRKILCIGGGRPGAGELLGAEYSLSVDEASDDPSRCWNLLPAGKRGAAGTLHYMGWFGARDGFVKLERDPAGARGPGR